WWDGGERTHLACSSRHLAGDVRRRDVVEVGAGNYETSPKGRWKSRPGSWWRGRTRVTVVGVVMMAGREREVAASTPDFLSPPDPKVELQPAQAKGRRWHPLRDAILIFIFRRCQSLRSFNLMASNGFDAPASGSSATELRAS
ncbi:hypothetical protein, partial [Verrucomicrobium spinosum]|uniref:hypothetical protein n=1 Tax=Verrucomicrobium spinosum TaxID=2736 RepID=UPI001C448DED